MEPPRRDEFAGKLIFAIRKLIECKKFDNTFMDKFLSSVNNEFCTRCNSIPNMTELSEWLSENFQKWRQNTPINSEMVFVFKFIGILTKYEQGFQLLQSSNTLNELSSILQSDMFEKAALKPVYISILSNILNHTSGYEWIKITKQLKVVNNLYFSNSNLYVEREGLNFLKKFIIKSASDDEINKEILQEIFLPINKCNEITIKDKNFCSVILLMLKLMESLLKMVIFSKNILYSLKFLQIIDIQGFLNFLLENCKQEIIYEKASVVQILLFVVQNEEKKKLHSLENNPALLDLFYAMLNRNQFNCITKLAKYCQVLWNDIRKEIKYENKTGIFFIIIQLLPALIHVTPTSKAACDVYIQKLLSLTSITGQKFCNILQDEIRNKLTLGPTNLALGGVLTVVSNKECLNFEEASLIFQAMMYLLKSLIYGNTCPSEAAAYNITEKGTFLSVQDTSLLSAVLNALCAFIKQFNINQVDSSENLCFIKMTYILLENMDLPSVVIVQVFLLIKLIILNVKSSDLALLLNRTENFSLYCLMPLLFKRLHDPNWEIRDSCLEVVAAIAEMSESKYPDFQEILLEKDFCSLVVDIMEGDSESYVRASAIQALRAMIKIYTLNQFLFQINLPQKILQLLENESEGIVRREAALAVTQIYLILDDLSSKIVAPFYEIMSYLAVNDLYWEVKVNSLIFWENVIERMIVDQGITDVSFPGLPFSKISKKIIELSDDEKKLRLNNVLRKLSEIGCLCVLLSSLNDDCDMPVIRKSAQIISNFLSILKRFGVMEYYKDFLIGDKVSVKRKTMVFENYEKIKTPNLNTRNNSRDDLTINNSESQKNEENPASSDVVIDGIVNEMDINLLVSVCFQNEKSASLQKKILLKEIKPEVFLLQIQNFELERFLENKQKWLVNVEVDLKSLMNEAYIANVTGETNIMDCY